MLKDGEKRFSQRYLDLIVNHHHKEIFKTLIANMNKTFHETLNQTRGRNPEQSQELDSWTSSQVIIRQNKHYKNLGFF